MYYQIIRCQRAARISIKAKLMDFTIKKQRLFDQECKIKWLKEGDENTFFYQSVISTLSGENGIFYPQRRNLR